MGARMAAFDWSRTPLGAAERWPQSLKTSVSICLASRFPIVLYWGPEYVVLYNDAYSQILGSKHPWALGQACRVCWAEIWGTIGPMLDGVLATGQATWSDDLLLRLRRFGYPEECYFSFSFSPVRVESGAAGGVFTAVIETTEKVIGERRLSTLRDLAARAVDAKSEDDAWRIAAETLAGNARDVPFAVLCRRVEGEIRIAGVSGIDEGNPICAALSRPGSELSAQAGEVLRSGQPAIVEDLGAFASNVPRGWWETPPRTGLLLPVAALGQGTTGVILAACSPAKSLDESYRTFFDLLTRQIATSIADARAYEEQHRRAEQLAELDRAKTAFFSNVSHEFRTPLTLLLGPLEDVLAQPPGALPEPEREQLLVVRRNALRLLRLVNTLLDFSRIEAGRVQAVYEPTDLCTFTREVASAFASAMERAGLRFSVACEPADEPVYVDREMWEKIVLNLVSNAFKFTFEGEIAVALRQVGERAELTVRDTGVGIPAAEMPRLFERFHRIEVSRSRTHEGTGIGLALVQELVRLHGGTVAVESIEGRGSTFTVSIPLGNAHLPPERIGRKRSGISSGLRLEGFVEEADRSTHGGSAAAEMDLTPLLPGLDAPPEPVKTEPQETILIADDNADMRDYLTHLLGSSYVVHAESDGISAVEAAVRLHPALILTDAMMPGLDGFGVLRAVRGDPELRSIPVILLSARAGEESRVEGLDAGADDYLVKPFTARELLARVGTHVRIAKVRREVAELQARLRGEAERERQRLREVLAQAPAAMGLLNGPEHRWVFVNDLYLRATGRNSADEFIGKTIRETLPELVGQPYFDLLDRVYRTGEPYSGREHMVWLKREASGELEEVYFDFVYQPIHGGDGEVEGILVHAIDVTDRVVARRLLEQSHQQLRSSYLGSQRLAAIVESSDDAIVSKDLHGIVRSWNPGAERMFGYTAAEMTGESILKIIPPELHDDERRILATIARGDRIQHFETVRMAKDGRRLEVSLTISPVRDETGKIVGASKIARDITRHKKAERALHITERLASVGRLAATVAHEINNPLEAVTNLVYLARCNSQDEVVTAHLAQAEEELARISLLTRQTLGFYRETRGARRLTLDSLVTPLVFAFQARARNKGIQIETEFRQNPEINAIPGEIRQVIANLLSNSIDAVEAQSAIGIRVSEVGFVRGRPCKGVRLTVADAGTGVPKEIRSKLFEAFFTTKKEVGTGLGLWVCRSIVEKHGGSIRLKSSPQAGASWTVFSVFLPVDAEIDEQSEEPERMRPGALPPFGESASPL
jgi:PAS domain S-box-containing protein